MKFSRTEDVLRLICGVTTTDEVARRHGVTAAEVERWRSDYQSAIEKLATAPRRQARVGVMFAATLVAIAVGSWSTDAWAQSCTQTLPNGLVTFCPDAPARADQVNQNFLREVQLLEQKVGTAGSAAVTMTGAVTSAGAVTVNNTLTTTGALSTPRINFTGTSGVVTWPAANVGAKLQMAGNAHELGVQNSTTYLRTSDTVAFYKGGQFDAAGAGPAGTTTFSVDGDGNAAAAGALRSRGDFVVKDVTTCCTGNGGVGCCPSGYGQVGRDLNTGAGGEFCYLCVKRAN